MTEAGADMIVCHMGLTTGGEIGARTNRSIDESIELIEACAERARQLRSDVLVLCHGGPIATPDDVAEVLGRSPSCHGFFGASSAERLPTEIAIRRQAAAFKAVARA